MMAQSEMMDSDIDGEWDFLDREANKCFIEDCEKNGVRDVEGAKKLFEALDKDYDYMPTTGKQTFLLPKKWPKSSPEDIIHFLSAERRQQRRQHAFKERNYFFVRYKKAKKGEKGRGEIKPDEWYKCHSPTGQSTCQKKSVSLMKECRKTLRPVVVRVIFYKIEDKIGLFQFELGNGKEYGRGDIKVRKRKRNTSNYGEDATLDGDNGHDKILCLAQNNNCEELQEYLAAKSEIPNLLDVTKDKFGYSALHIAAREGNTDMVNLLLAMGADVNIQTDKNWSTPLHQAAYHGRGGIISILLKDKKCKHKVQTRGGYLPCHNAVNKIICKILPVEEKERYDDVIKHLLKNHQKKGSLDYVRHKYPSSQYWTAKHKELLRSKLDCIFSQ